MMITSSRKGGGIFSNYLHSTFKESDETIFNSMITMLAIFVMTLLFRRREEKVMSKRNLTTNKLHTHSKLRKRDTPKR